MTPPEIRDIPNLAYGFHWAGILVPMIKNFISIDTPQARDPFLDGKKLREIIPTKVSGTENFPSKGANFLVLNHPDVAILVPAALSLLCEFNYQTGRKDINFLMGDISPLEIQNKLGKALYEKMLKGVRNFAATYPNNIVLTTTQRVNENYSETRNASKQKIMNRMLTGNVVALAPEGRPGNNNVLQSKKIPRHGAGEIALTAKTYKIPVLPVAIWKDQEQIQLNIGEQFFPNKKTGPEAVLELMEHIAYLLPKQLRGPYEGRN